MYGIFFQQKETWELTRIYGSDGEVTLCFEGPKQRTINLAMTASGARKFANELQLKAMDAEATDPRQYAQTGEDK
jgi:hypothetical protein